MCQREQERIVKFMPFLHIDMTQLVETLFQAGQGFTYST